MNLEKIKSIIQDYDELYELAEEKIKILESIDLMYSTRRYIEDITIGGDVVIVRCDDTCRGCYDSHSFRFPTEWLSKSEDELKELVKKEKELREEKERLREEEKRKRQKEEKEERDRNQYERLKKKFEDK